MADPPREMPNKPVVRTKKEPMGVHIDERLNITREGGPRLTVEVEQTFREAMLALNDSGAQYAVGAAFARNLYTGIWRSTKDLDVFITPACLKPALVSLRKDGFRTRIVEKHWLAKAYKDEHFIDIVFGTGHGHYTIDSCSFEGSQEAEVLGVPTCLFPVEEMIVSAMYIATRQRFDGAEVAHLIHGMEGKLDWDRIVARLGDNRGLLLWHLVFFDFVYPGRSAYLPKDLMEDLFNELRSRWEKPGRKKKAFRGMLLDPYSFTVDVEDWGYEDRRRLDPLVDGKGEVL